jgi:RNA polymerase sigma factor (sigma-70 family)
MADQEKPHVAFSEIDRMIENFSRLIRAAIGKTSPHLSPAEMADIEQEVKISLWKEIRKSEKEIRNLGSYIWKVAFTTTCKMMKRAAAQRRALVRSQDGLSPRELERQGGADSPNHKFENKEMLEAVRAAVDSLIDSRRQVVSLFLDGMSADEITSYFGWSDGKARNLLSRGLADVRQALKERGIGFEE